MVAQTFFFCIRINHTLGQIHRITLHLHQNCIGIVLFPMFFIFIFISLTFWHQFLTFHCTGTKYWSESLIILNELLWEMQQKKSEKSAKCKKVKKGYMRMGCKRQIKIRIASHTDYEIFLNFSHLLYRTTVPSLVIINQKFPSLRPTIICKHASSRLIIVWTLRFIFTPLQVIPHKLYARSWCIKPM